MLNVLLLACIFFLEVIFIIRFSKLSKEWLYGFIIVNLLLVSVLGGKLISVFGFTTNTGNVFYAAVFMATYVLVECFSTNDAYQSVWIGSISVFLFMLMAQLVKSMVAIPEARVIDQSIYNLVQTNLRVSVASIFSFITAQSINIWLYQLLRKKTKTKHFWLRVLVSNGAAQVVDSLLFFFHCVRRSCAF